MGSHHHLSLFVVVFVLFLCSFSQGKKHGVYYGGRIIAEGPYLVGLGSIDHNQNQRKLSKQKWDIPGVDLPAYDIGYFMDGLILEDDLDVYYFSGKFVDDSKGFQNLTLTPGLIRCLSSPLPDTQQTDPNPATPHPAPSPSAPPLGVCDNVFPSSSSPFCPFIPSIAAYKSNLAMACDGPPSFLSPGSTTAFVLDITTGKWESASIPCDAYGVRDQYYCNIKRVWRLQVPLEQPAPLSGTDNRFFIFLTRYPLTNTYNLVTYTKFSATLWSWANLLPAFKNTVNQATSVTDLSQNNVTGDIWISGGFLCPRVVQKTCHVALLNVVQKPYDLTTKGYHVPSAPTNIQVMTTDGSVNGTSEDYLVVISGTFHNTLSYYDEDCGTCSIGYLSSFQTDFFCFPCCDDFWDCLKMDKDHPLAVYIIEEDVPLMNGTYTKQFLQPWSPGYSYVVSYPLDDFSPDSPYLLVYDQDGEDGGRWSQPTYPNGIGGDAFCPVFACSLSIIHASSLPPNYGHNAVVMSSSDIDFNQSVTILNASYLFHPPPSPSPSPSPFPYPIINPSPSPSPFPAILPSPSPSTIPAFLPSPTPSPSPYPFFALFPSPTPAILPTPTPTSTPSPTPTSTPTPTPVSTPSPTPTSTPSPTPVPTPTSPSSPPPSSSVPTPSPSSSLSDAPKPPPEEYVLLFSLSLLTYGEVDCITTSFSTPELKESLMISGRFRGNTLPSDLKHEYHNVAILSTDRKNKRRVWVGVGKSHGITTGVVRMLLQLDRTSLPTKSALTDDTMNDKNVTIGGEVEVGRIEGGDENETGILMAVGYFNQEGVKNVAMIDDCADQWCSSSTWKKVLPYEFSEDAVIMTAAYFDPYLVLGGSFSITNDKGKIYQNFIIYNFENQEILLESGLEQGVVDDGSLSCEHGVKGFCPCVETITIINNEIWIGGTFNTSKTNEGATGQKKGPFVYSSLARFDMTNRIWLPILGVQRVTEDVEALPGTVTSLIFYSANSEISSTRNKNTVSTPKEGSLSLVLFIGGIFGAPANGVGFSIPLFNFGAACISVKNGTIQNQGVLGYSFNFTSSTTSQLQPTTTTTKQRHSRGLPSPAHSVDLISTCAGGYGAYLSVGGANGPVMSLISFTTDRGEDEILLGGSFSSTLGLTDRKTVECPLLRYNPSSDDWSSIDNQPETCYGTVFSFADFTYERNQVFSSSWFGILCLLVLLAMFGVACLLIYRRYKHGLAINFPRRFTIQDDETAYHFDSEYSLGDDVTREPLLNVWRKNLDDNFNFNGDGEGGGLGSGGGGGGVEAVGGGGIRWGSEDEDENSRHSAGSTGSGEIRASRRDHPLQAGISLMPFISREKIVHPYRIYIRGFGKIDTPRREVSKKARKSELKQPKYQVEVRCGVSMWTVDRKYVDFLNLHRALCQKYPAVELPLLPPRVFEARQQFSEMTDRLQSYLRELIDCSFAEKLSRIQLQSGQTADSANSYLLQDDIRGFLFEGQIKSQIGGMESYALDISDIQVKKRIGFGSFAEVYQGKWKGMEVAVKVLLPSVAGDGKLLTEFTAETALMAKLHHRNVLSFYGAYCKPPNLCIVTEWMSRGSLYDIIHGEESHFERFPLRFRMKLAHDVALGVSYLHSIVPPVIHRDLKSLNLLVDSNWLVKVADFGLSKIKDFFEETSSMVGTPAWTAPEVLRGDRYDEKADVYSFGVILWEIMTGHRPFSGYRLRQVIAAVCDSKERPSDLVSVPIEDSDVEVLIQACWADDRNERPPFTEICLQIADIMLRLEKEREKEKGGPPLEREKERERKIFTPKALFSSSALSQVLNFSGSETESESEHSEEELEEVFQRASRTSVEALDRRREGREKMMFFYGKEGEGEGKEKEEEEDVDGDVVIAEGSEVWFSDDV